MTRSARPTPRRWTARGPAIRASSGSCRKQQTAGRGRRGRAWADAAGQSRRDACSLVASGELRLAATLGFVAGLALADALDAVVPNRRDRASALDGGAARGEPLRAEMAERRAGRRRQARRHPARSGDARRRPACGRRSASASMSSPHPDGRALSGDVARGARRRRSTPRRCSWRCRTPGSSNARIWDGGRGFAAIRERWLDARRRARRADRGQRRRRASCAACSRRSTRTAASSSAPTAARRDDRRRRRAFRRGRVAGAA